MGGFFYYRAGLAEILIIDNTDERKNEMKKLKMKRFLGLVLTFALVLTSVPLTGLAETEQSAVTSEEDAENEPVVLSEDGIVASGTCGDNLTWELDSEGALTISGTGEMYNYKVDRPSHKNDMYAPWYEFKDQLKSLRISEGVTSIGDFAFFECSGFTGDLMIPNSIVTIGESAFEWCTGFNGELLIPNSVTAINYRAFLKCTGLVGDLEIPDSVTLLGGGAFSGCSGFRGNLIIPNSVTYLGYRVFSGCSGFTGNLEIPDSVTGIGDHAFYSCSGFTGNLEIPDSVTDIDDSAFYGCSGFTGNLEIPDSVTDIGDSAFFGCTKLEHIYLGSGVNSIGEEAFQGCKSLTDISVDNNNNNYCSQNGVLFDKNKTKLIRFPAGKSGNYEIPYGVITIADHSFASCNNLCDIIISSSVISIEDSAFSYSNLSCITIPTSVSSIGDYSFSGCESLTDVFFMGKALSIGENAFYKSVLTSYYPYNDSTWTEDSLQNYGGTITWKKWNPETGEIYEDNSEESYSGSCGENLTWILEDGVLTISGTGPMRDFDNLGEDKDLTPWHDYEAEIKKVIIEDGVTTVGSNAFSYCENLYDVYIGKDIVSLEKWAFSSCDNLKEIYFYGDIPQFKDKDTIFDTDDEIDREVFLDVSATVYYPVNNDTWTKDAWEDHGGELVWTDWNPETGNKGAFFVYPEKCYLNTGDVFTVTAVYEDSNGNIADAGNLIWSKHVWRTDSLSVVEFGEKSDNYDNYSIEIKAQTPGTAYISAEAENGMIAPSIEVTVEMHAGIVSLSFRSDSANCTGENSNVDESETSGIMQHDFYYDDEFFYKDNTKYNNSLAVMTLGMELTSYSSPKYDDKYTDTLSQNERAENIKDAYAKLGFFNAEYYNYNVPLSDNSDKVAFSIATKKITDGESSDTLIAVVIRGGGYGAEWGSNFNVGNNGNATGFDSAAKSVLTELKQYVSNAEVSGSLKFWITGYSRGAATANILTHYINADLSNIHSSLKHEDIYSYTFATPNGYRKTESNVVDDSNIINIVSANDLVPKVALKMWGFSKYGQTFVLPEYNSSVINKNFKYLMGKELNIYNANGFENGITDLLFDMTLNTDGYVSHFQDAFVDSFSKEFATSSGDFFGVVPRLFLKAIWAGNISAEAKARFVYTLACLTGEISTAVLNSVLDGNDNAFEVMLDLISDKNLLGIANVHYPEHYLSWLESGGQLLITSDFFAKLNQDGKTNIHNYVVELFDSTYLKYSFFCPVDVNIYDSSDNLVVSIVDNEVVVDTLPCYVDGDNKIVYITGDDTYRFELTGNDDGSMDYIVEEFDNSSEIVRSVYYYDVPLEKGVTYTDTCKNNILNADEDYSITNGTVITKAALDTLVDDATEYTITIKNGGSSKSNAMEGERIEICSIVDDGYEFVGWSSDAEFNIFNDPTEAFTTIQMPSKDVTITAEWRRVDEEIIDLSTCSLSLSESEYIYDGTEKEPTVTITNGDQTLIEGTDYTVTYSDNVNAGTGSVTATGQSNYTGTITETFTIKKADQEIKATISSADLVEGETAAIEASATAGTLSYSSSDTAVATVDENGIVTAVSVGTVTITISTEGNENYNPATTAIEITVTEKPQQHTHEYGDPVFEWAEDYSCKAVFTCKDKDDEQTLDCTVTSEVTDPTCTKDGETVYTATVEFDGQTYTDTKTVPGDPATGHSYEYTDNGDGTHTATCVNGDDSFTEAHIFKDGVCICGAKEETPSESESPSEPESPAEPESPEESESSESSKPAETVKPWWKAWLEKWFGNTEETPEETPSESESATEQEQPSESESESPTEPEQPSESEQTSESTPENQDPGFNIWDWLFSWWW
ncbi:MAG: leucine-rich repeat protein [Lachnospiraceae bacterium]